jgi:soluble lytic murein transglycosylase
MKKFVGFLLISFVVVCGGGFKSSSVVLASSTVSTSAPSTVSALSKDSSSSSATVSVSSRVSVPSTDSVLSSSLVTLKDSFFQGDWSRCTALAPKVIQEHPSISDWILLTWLRCIKGASLQKQSLEPLENFLKEANKISVETFFVTHKPLRQEYESLLDVLGESKIKGISTFLQSGQKTKTDNTEKTEKKAYESEKDLQKGREALSLLDQLDSPSSQKGSSSKKNQEKDFLEAVKKSVVYLTEFPLGLYSEKIEAQLYQRWVGLPWGEKSFWRKSLRYKTGDHLEKVPLLYLEKWMKKSHRKGDYQDSLALAQKILKRQEIPEALWILGRSQFYLGQYEESEKTFLKIIESYPKFQEIEDTFFKLSFGYLRTQQWSKAHQWLTSMTGLSLDSKSDIVCRYWLIRAKEKLDSTNQEIRGLKETLVTRYPFSYYSLLLQKELYGNLRLPLLSTQLNKPTQLHKATQSHKATQEPSFFQSSITSLKGSLVLPQDKKSLQRVLLLASEGWLDEAFAELRSLNTKDFSQEAWKSLGSFSLETSFYQAMVLVLNQWDFSVSPQAVPQQWVEVSYPRPFTSLVQEFASKNGLSPLLVWSLMRQESLFLPLVESSSQAVGLMQMIPPTAKEVSVTLKKPLLHWSLEGRQPRVNIEFGTRYIRDLIKSFDGHIPMALAAYNYGPTRLKSWKNLRDLSGLKKEGKLQGLNSQNLTQQNLTQQDLKFQNLNSQDLKAQDINAQKSNPPRSNPQDTLFQEETFADLWIDELPAAETQFYVKAILGSVLIYQSLEKGSEPMVFKKDFWKSLIF